MYAHTNTQYCICSLFFRFNYQNVIKKVANHDLNSRLSHVVTLSAYCLYKTAVCVSVCPDCMLLVSQCYKGAEQQGGVRHKLLTANAQYGCRNL